MVTERQLPVSTVLALKKPFFQESNKHKTTAQDQIHDVFSQTKTAASLCLHFLLDCTQMRYSCSREERRKKIIIINNYKFLQKAITYIFQVGAKNKV